MHLQTSLKVPPDGYGFDIACPRERGHGTGHRATGVIGVRGIEILRCAQDEIGGLMMFVGLRLPQSLRSFAMTEKARRFYACSRVGGDQGLSSLGKHC